MPRSREGEEAARQAEGGRQAERARAVVAEQIAELVRESGMTGSDQHFANRLHEMIAARNARPYDKEVHRAAVMEVARAAALLAVRLDLRQDSPLPSAV